MSPRKQGKKINKNIFPDSYVLIILSSIIIILFSALIACLINIQKRDDQEKVIQNVTKTEALVEPKDEVKSLRFWGMVLGKWHEAGIKIIYENF